jgi:hypothetical protein
MNSYRFRLVLASVSLTAALTVLALKLSGFIPAVGSADELRFTATTRAPHSTISPWQIYCRDENATIVDSRQGGPPRQLLDYQGRQLRCHTSP